MGNSTTRRPTWFFGLLISLDQLMNATFWPLGNWAFKTDMFGVVSTNSISAGVLTGRLALSIGL